MKYLSIILIILLTGCSILRDPVKVKKEYRHQIEDWQERVRQEGWTENLIRDIHLGCIHISSYKSEDRDHWDTPNEFIQAGFKGDCEDIASHIWGTFKTLDYPYQIRMCGVIASMGEHGLVRIEMPDGKWKTLESVWQNTIGGEWIFYRRFVEWDAHSIY